MSDQTCTLCIMDSSCGNISFDEAGICNYCRDAQSRLPHYKFSDIEVENNLEQLKGRIRKRKTGEYDVIVGLSGGVDSSYVAYLANKLDLNALCVHFDNGWNSDVAVKNIRNIIDRTGYDLCTYVIDWSEFRDLQRAFLKASVIDIEMLSDHAIFASLYKIRKEHNIQTVLSGTNYNTEHGMPKEWVWPKMDLKNIKYIQKQFGAKSLKSFPTMSSFFWLLMRRFGVGGVYEEPLNLINYSKMHAMHELEKEFDWKYYGGKHYESVFTKFYQAYILPEKFGVDKRKVHLSCLIRNNEMTREEALEEMN